MYSAKPSRAVPAAIIAAIALMLAMVAPAAAATVCGEVSEFTAPVAGTTAGSITIDGETRAIDADATITATTIAQLTTIAELDATVCLNIEPDTGEITAISIAGVAQLCGVVTVNELGVFAIGGTDLTAEALALIAADTELTALLNAAAAGGASVCLDLVLNEAGLIAAVRLDATIALCGTATLDADSVTIAGVDVPLALLDAEAQAALELAIAAGVDVCLNVNVADNEIVSATLNATIELCGEVTFDADGNAHVNGVLIPSEFLDASLIAALELAASADGEVCVFVDADSTGTTTTVEAVVTITLCATVTAIGDGTVTLDGVTLVLATELDADVQVGDELCVVIIGSPGGGTVIVEAGSETAAPTPGTPVGGGTPGSLPDSGTAPVDGSFGWAAAIVAALLAGAGYRRQRGISVSS